MTLLSLLASTGAVCANPNAAAGPIQPGVYQFAKNNKLHAYKLCTYEVCRPNAEGILETVRTTVGSVQD